MDAGDGEALRLTFAKPTRSVVERMNRAVFGES